MENLFAAALRQLEQSVGSLKAAIDESHSRLREIGAWKSRVDGTPQKIRPDKANSRQQLRPVILNPFPGLDLGMPQAHTIAAAMEGGASALVDFASNSSIGVLEVVVSSL
jgi:hypothetical protein